MKPHGIYIPKMPTQAATKWTMPAGPPPVTYVWRRESKFRVDLFAYNGSPYPRTYALIVGIGAGRKRIYTYTPEPMWMEHTLSWPKAKALAVVALRLAGVVVTDVRNND